MTGKVFILGLAAVSLMVCLAGDRTAAGAAQEEAAPAGMYEKYACPGNFFQVSVPAGWQRQEKDHPYGDLTKVHGVKLTGPKNRDGATVAISVLYYTGEGIFSDSGKFIRNQLNSLVRIDHDREPVIADTKIAGRSAKQFKIKAFELIHLPLRDMPLGSPEGRVYEILPPSKQVVMIRQFIVIPLEKGFYALTYSVPEDVAETHRPVFEKVAATFEPRVP